MIQKTKTTQGETPSFPVLFETYKNLVFKTAFLMLGSAEEAEDALQEVFVLVYRALDRYDSRLGALTTWLHRITVNYCLGRLRKKHIEILVDDDGERLENMAGDGEEAKGLEEREAMLQAIRGLSAAYQVVVILRYYWDLPYAEIAAVLDIPLGTVKSRLDHATRQLRKILSTGADVSSGKRLGNEIVGQREMRSCQP